MFILGPLSRLQPEILSKIKTLFSSEIATLVKAYNLSKLKLIDKKIHERELFDHAVCTALHLGELKPNTDAIAAALLKDLPDTSDFSYAEIKNNFGQEIYDIVKYLNNLKNIRTASKRENLKKIQQMFLALSEDVRVIIIKICSLLDLLEHLELIDERHRTRLAIEAMNIYAPIADIIGIWRLKWQLEDNAFRFLNPTEYFKIEKRFNIEEKKDRDKYISNIKQVVEQAARNQGITCAISGRFKHFYSIYQKMQLKEKSFDNVHDVFALRVVVETLDDCYRMLGIIHSLWPPKAKRLKDYIAAPKSNHYRSLHTTVVGPNKRSTEFQIRTREMDEEAKYGIAAHWQYKNREAITPSWIQSLLIDRAQKVSEHKIWEKINTTVLFDLIFVYTPKGDIISLPKNATPVDFAYQIHTEIGHHTIGAKINGQISLLDTSLKNGDHVEIIINKDDYTVTRDWLKFVKSSLARHAIKNYFYKNGE